MRWLARHAETLARWRADRLADRAKALLARSKRWTALADRLRSRWWPQ